MLEQAMKFAPGSVKACYRAGQAHFYLKHFQEALDVLNMGSMMHPNHPQLLQLLSQSRISLQAEQALQSEQRRTAACETWREQTLLRV